MAPPKSRAAALALLLAAACICVPVAAVQRGAGLRQEQRQSLPLPPPLASLACSLAGGWCPGDDADPQPRLPDVKCTVGSSNCSNGSGMDPTSQPHKPLWPLSTADWAGLGAAAAALLLAASGGLGGGAILVPLYLMVLGTQSTACFPCRTHGTVRQPPCCA